MNRREFFATLAAIPLAAVPAANASPNLGLEMVSVSLGTTSFSLDNLNELYARCCVGREHPTQIWMGREIWDEFRRMVPEQQQFYDSNGPLHLAGHKTILFGDAEVTEGFGMGDGTSRDVWFVGPDSRDMRYAVQLGYASF